MSPSYSLSVVPIERLTEPRQHEDPAPARRRDDRSHLHGQALGREDDVRAAAGPDHRHLGLVVELVGADAVRPHAGGVDDRLGRDRERLAGLGVADLGAAGAAALLDQPGHLEPVGEHGPEALGLAEHGQDQPHVVGLAVVEEVAAGGLAAGQRGQQLDDLVAADHAVARRAPVRVPVEVAVADAAAAERRAPQPVDRHHVVHVQPEAEQAVGARAAEGGHDHRQRPHEVRGERGVDLALEQRLAHEPEVEVLQVAQAAVDELARARRGAGGVVGLLDQRDRVAARGGVERDAGAGDAAADHQHVERLGGEGGDGVRAREHLGEGTRGTRRAGRARAPPCPAPWRGRGARGRARARSRGSRRRRGPRACAGRRASASSRRGRGRGRRAGG